MGFEAPPLGLSALPLLRRRIDYAYLGAREGRKLPLPFNNGNTVGFATEAGADTTDWRAATGPTVKLNGWHRYQSGLLRPTVGRTYVITRIVVMTSMAADLQLVLIRDRQQTLSGALGQSFLINFDENYVESTVNNRAEFVFGADSPLILSSGDTLGLYGRTTTTPGFNWMAQCYGWDITDDHDYDASNTLLVVGDSIGGVTADTTAMKYVRREDGSTTGLWPFLVKEFYRDHGIDVRLANICVGGTTAVDWDWYANVGRVPFRGMAGMYVNLGMNDAATAANISTAGGTDGKMQKALKNLIRYYFRANPGGHCIVSQITDTDASAQLTTIAGGRYNGLTQLAAARLDLAEAVNALIAANPSWDLKLADCSTAYSASTGTAFISTESAGQRKHPNDTVGQPAMASIINTALATTTWFNAKKTS